MPHPTDWPLALLADAAAFAFGYLLGSIPFGLILTRLAGTGDIRAIGSGNIGATNVLRTGRKGLAAATLLGDMLKGTAAVMLVQRFHGQDLAILAALGALLGHLFPVWLGFRGGKGVATYLGLLLGFQLWSGFAAFGIVWLTIAALTRYSSLAALCASAVTPAVLWWRSEMPLVALFLALSVLLWVMHRANIARLLRGTEGKIGGGAREQAGG
jgi:glycerol-3-phosphate acyltransferase PlsY